MITPEFHKAIIEQSKIPFQYGVNDCALFVNAIYKKVFGMDLAGDLVGTYNDEYHAARVLVRLGYWDGILLPKGFKKLENKNFVNVGDIVICEKAAGIYVGDCRAVFAGNVFRSFDKIETVYTYRG